MENISQHISYKEATASSTALLQGIVNKPNPQQLANMKNLAAEVFEPLRVAMGAPIRINSFFRSVALNKKIGGSATSQHCTGEAIDIDATGEKTNADLFNYIRENLPFDQLIWEFGNDNNPEWVHVSYSRRNRKSVLRARKVKGKTTYTAI